MNPAQTKVPSMVHTLLRRGLAGLMLLAGMTLGAAVAAGPAEAQSGPYCTPFASALEGWGACPTAPNIAVTTSNTGSIGGVADWFLKLTDQSGASAACSSDRKYQGNWVEKMGGNCGQFCFDIRIIEIPLAPTTVIHPSFTIFTSAGLRADYYSNTTATTDSGSSPGWHHICAPVKLTQPGENLPSDSGGHWGIGGSTAPNAQWNQIITNVDHVQLPVDFTPQPSEVVGYDNICMGPADCTGTGGGGGGGQTTADCLKDINAQVKCNPDGTYTLTTTGTGFAGTDVSLTPQTPGITVEPQQQPWSATMTWTLVGATAGQSVTLTAKATKLGGGDAAGTDSCCSGEIKITLPECPKPVDVKIEKTGGTSPAAQVNAYAFHLKVTNVGAAFTGTNALTVTDVVPVGMTFTSASGGPNWTCAPPTVPAAGTLTCTYVGTGPTAPNQVLGTIDISATAMGAPPFPPFLNCATVGFTTASGLVDANTLDNTSCVTVQKAALCTPMVAGPVPGSCVCPQGTVLMGSECVKQPPQICALPMISGPVAGTCVCPQGTVLMGRECVKQPQTCTPPMVPGPVAGSCVCPQGTVLIRGECLKQPQACTPPMVPGAVAGSCVCPQGTVLIGGACVRQQQACTPPMVPGPVAGSCVCPQGTVLIRGECLKQPQACAPPMVPGAVAGSCVCPQGTVLIGGACMRQQQACTPPMVPGAVAGSCVCPQGTVLMGRECVRQQQQACTPPMVPGAVAGSCVCPQGTVLMGRECVRQQQQACTPPMVPGAVAGSCVCPQGTVAEGRDCVRQPEHIVPQLPFGLPRNFGPGGPQREEPRQPGGGGQQGPAGAGGAGVK